MLRDVNLLGHSGGGHWRALIVRPEILADHAMPGEREALDLVALQETPGFAVEEAMVAMDNRWQHRTKRGEKTNADNEKNEQVCETTEGGTKADSKARRIFSSGGARLDRSEMADTNSQKFKVSRLSLSKIVKILPTSPGSRCGAESRTKLRKNLRGMPCCRFS